jgi:outer membrane cobalamin receptor
MSYSPESHLLNRLLLAFRFLYIGAFLCVCGQTFGQVSEIDSVFQMEQLGYEDLLFSLPDEAREIFGANRLSENVDELPLRAYIVTRKEILQNGYATLVDVLKHVPGFRTSQPGDALLGETFLMRGLVGNLYTKILINGIPLDPSAAKGMPLAASLPIRQAKRIEIILGPASSLYGPDALAGVINIVLSTVERPVEAMGSVALGNKGTTEMHLALGGKVGRGRNVLNYMIYGSNKQMDDIGLKLPDSLIRLDTNSLGLKSPEYHFEGQDSTLPRVEEFPHESRILGVALSFRGFSLNSNTLFRADNMTLGSHPEDISYDAPHGKIIDNIFANRLRYEKSFGKLALRSNLSSVIYKIDNQSEYTGVAHPISTGRNHMYASSNDLQAEQLAFYQLTEKLLVMGGISYKRMHGEAFQGYLERPFGEGSVYLDPIQQVNVVDNAADDLSAVSPVGEFNTYDLNEFGAFAQVNFQTKRFRVNGGGRLDRAWDGEYRFSPKLGATVELTDKIRLRSFFGQAYRSPSTFNRFNNYEERMVPAGPGLPLRASLERVEQDLNAESLTSIEGGVVFEISEHLRAEAHFFHHSLTNSIFPSLQYSTRLQEEVWLGPPDPNADTTAPKIFGYINANSVSKLSAFQGFVTYQNKFLKVDLFGQFNIGREKIVGVDTINSYRSLPQLMGQANVHLDLPKLFRISIYSQLFSDFTWGIAKVNNQIIVRESQGFWNIDLVIGKDFTDRFMGYFRMTNVLNSSSRGIFTTDVSGFQFDYLPQQETLFTVGLTYHLQ